MKCPDCGATVPNNMLACEACLDRRNLKEVVEAQQEYIRRILAGKGQLNIRRRAKFMFGGHLQLTLLPDMAYCGERLNRGYPVREIVELGSKHSDPLLRRKSVCSKCLKVYDELVVKVTA
jgi:hypothetical protein